MTRPTHTRRARVTGLILLVLSTSALGQESAVADPAALGTSALSTRQSGDPVTKILEGVTYRRTQTFQWDDLFEFERTGREVQLFTDCGLPYDCDLYGFWDTPYPYEQTGSRTYVITYNLATVVSTYELSVQLDGSILVSAAHDQCYFGCSFPPLALIGVFEPVP